MLPCQWSPKKIAPRWLESWRVLRPAQMHMPFLRPKPHAMRQWKVRCRVVVSPLGNPPGSHLLFPIKLGVIEHLPIFAPSLWIPTVAAPICNEFLNPFWILYLNHGNQNRLRSFRWKLGFQGLPWKHTEIECLACGTADGELEELRQHGPNSDFAAPVMDGW